MNMQLFRMSTSVALFVLLSEPPGVRGYKTRALEARQVFGIVGSVNERLLVPYRTDIDVGHKMDCVIECVNNVSCVAVEHFDETCRFFDDLGLPAVSNAFTTHAFVIARDIMVLIAASTDGNRYSYTFPEAQQACTSIGARLANRSQLQAMYDEGYGLCRCGWTSEGDLVYPMQVSIAGCGNNVGLNPCEEWSQKGDGWCSFH